VGREGAAVGVLPQEERRLDASGGAVLGERVQEHAVCAALAFSVQA